MLKDTANHMSDTAGLYFPVIIFLAVVKKTRIAWDRALLPLCCDVILVSLPLLSLRFRRPIVGN